MSNARFVVRRINYMPKNFWLYDSSQFLECFTTELEAITAIQPIGNDGDGIEVIDHSTQEVTNCYVFVAIQNVTEAQA